MWRALRASVALPGILPPVVWSPRPSLRLGRSGCLLMDSPLPASRHPQLFLHTVELRGLEAPLRDLVADSFNLAVVDCARDQVLIANDPVGSVALYYAQVPGGVIATTIPGLLRRAIFSPPSWPGRAAPG